MTTTRASGSRPHQQTSVSWSRILNWSLGLPVLGLEGMRWAGSLSFEGPALMLPPLFSLFGISLMVGLWESYDSQREEAVYSFLLQVALLICWGVICAERLLAR
ncbi:hypothetical protein [Deinococcus sp.]|uniref:hypothetical protein n=1 Tax=Deinococcus sp. TaxID=47478 RepID=UPI003B5C8607